MFPSPHAGEYLLNEKSPLSGTAPRSSITMLGEMTAAETTLDRETEAGRVVDWRRAALERAGYDTSSASKIAARADVDLHYAVDLLRSGCPAETALQILL
jgi:hypothetical protein